jgi:hypothetical protein
MELHFNANLEYQAQAVKKMDLTAALRDVKFVQEALAQMTWYQHIALFISS